MENTESRMVTVELLVPTSRDTFNGRATEPIHVDDLTSYVENELTGPLDMWTDDGEEIEVEVGAVGEIDPALIDDGMRYRRHKIAEALAAPLVQAQKNAAQAALEARGALENAKLRLSDIGDEYNDGLAADLADILTALDDWHTASITALQAVYPGHPHLPAEVSAQEGA